jgi:hypothetical protein
MMVTKIHTGDCAVIFMSDESGENMAGTVTKIVTSRTGKLRRVGITPDGTDVVAWFSPVPWRAGLVSVGSTTVAYV